MTAALDNATSTHPLLNVLVHGFRPPSPQVPENAEILAAHQDLTMRTFSPRNPWHLWLTDDIALMMVRLDRVSRIERRERDRAALRAESFWDDDRRLLAEDLGARIGKDPARVVARLRTTPQGCDWLVERWGWLGRVLEVGQTWDEPQTKLALDLLGTPKEVRAAAAAWVADPARLVRDEVAALTAQKARVAESDALDRSLAMTDSAQPNTAEFRRLKRYEASLHRRMRWAIEQLDLIPKFADPHPDLLAIRAQPETRPDPPERITKPEPRPRPVPKTEPTPTPAPPRRPDPVKQRARVRDAAARRRREDRPDR